MHVTDSERAARGATLVLGAMVALVAILVLSYLIGFFMPTVDGPWPTIEEVLWLTSDVVTIVGLLQLAFGLADKKLAHLTAGSLVLVAVFEVARLLSNVRGLGLVVNDLELAISLGARGSLLLLMVRLGGAWRAWVVPMLGAAAVLTLMRLSWSMAVMHGLVELELFRNPAFAYALGGVAFFNAGAFVVGAFAVREAVKGAAGFAADGPQETESVSPATDFMVGGVLLMLGVGGTMLSLAAASTGGGRYVVSTGAIGVGIVRLIRGFMRLSKQP